ncbi:hypothetical protein U1Q18_005076 [Sarracenia purpurea var. burkii]
MPRLRRRSSVSSLSTPCQAVTAHFGLPGRAFSCSHRSLRRCLPPVASPSLHGCGASALTVPSTLQKLMHDLAPVLPLS